MAAAELDRHRRGVVGVRAFAQLAVGVRAVDEDVASGRQIRDVDRLAFPLRHVVVAEAGRDALSQRARVGPVAAAVAGPARAPVQGARLVRVVQAEARLAVAAEQLSGPAELVALEAREVPVPVRPRTDEAKRRRQLVPSLADELRSAHQVAGALALDDERRRADVVHRGAEDEQQPAASRDDGDAERRGLVEVRQRRRAPHARASAERARDPQRFGARQLALEAQREVAARPDQALPTR